jgi:hypothetical protein
MKFETLKAKLVLWLKKRSLMTLRAIVWRADEWIQRQEVALRAELSVPVPVEPPGPARPQGRTVSCPFPFPADELVRRGIRGRAARLREPQRTEKKERRHVTAADFDRRFA